MKGHIIAWILPGALSEQAAGIAAEIQKTFPGKVGVTATTGICLFPTIDFTKEEAIRNIEKALRHASFFGPESLAFCDAISLNVWGDKLYQENDVDGAIKEFKRALKIDPDDMNVLNSLGVCYAEKGKLKKAYECFDKAHKIDPEELMPLYNMGLSKLLSKKNEEALNFLEKALEINPESFETLISAGNAAENQGKNELAGSLFEKAVSVKPKAWAGHTHLANFYLNEKQYKNAARQFQEAVKANPNDGESFSHLAWIYANHLDENLDVALSFAEQSVLLQPENGFYRFRLGGILGKAGNFEKSTQEFKKALELGYECEPEIEDINKKLALAKGPATDGGEPA